MLRSRLVYGSAMIAGFLGLMLADLWLTPYYPLFALLIGGIVLLAARELVDLLEGTALGVSLRFCQLGVLAIVLSCWAAPLAGRGGSDPAIPLVVFAVIGAFAFVWSAARFETPGGAVATIAGHLFVLFYLAVLGSFVTQIRWLGSEPAHGALAFLMMALTAKCCDIGAYFIGRRIGRRKLAPTLSPGKTWEGSLGGLATAVLVAVLLAALTRGALGVTILETGWAALFGLAIGVAAQVGDLMESLIKRDCGQKDASSRIPGFGGVLDVIDSILFAGPVAYVFLGQFV